MIERESSSRRERGKWLQTQQRLNQSQAAGLLAPRVGARRARGVPSGLRRAAVGWDLRGRGHGRGGLREAAMPPERDGRAPLRTASGGRGRGKAQPCLGSKDAPTSSQRVFLQTPFVEF